jgi:outer membrane phospholipase A
MSLPRRLLSPARAGAFLLCCCIAADAAAGWLIATADESAEVGALLEFQVVRPDVAQVWPATLRLRLQRDGATVGEIDLRADDVDGEGLRRRYRAPLPSLPAGLLRATLADRPSNRLALVVRPAGSVDTLERMAGPSPAGDGVRLDPLPDEEPALSANEPMYIVAGARDGLDARFQLSFKYRLFDAQSLPARLFAPLARLHFGYTQTSLWDLGENSRPFRDTSYRPSLFWQGRVGESGGLVPDYLRGGYEHESNGRDGDKSRSIDMLFVQPAWRREFADGSTFFFAPRVHTYLDRGDNRDIARYRGHADWIMRYGKEDGWILSARLRRGTAGYGSGQLDLSFPLREPLFSRVGGFLHFQVFSGYGETLLDYNVKRPPQFRIGFSIVR